MSEAQHDVRRTQRAPKRCQPCAKRRRRCTGNGFPCDECIARAIAHECRRETVLVKGRIEGMGDQLATSATLQSLSRETLWAQVQSLTMEVKRLREGRAVQAPMAEAQQCPPLSPTSEMGSLAKRLGYVQQEEPVYSVHRSSNLSSFMPFPDHARLPQAELGRRLIAFALDDVGWLLCPIPLSFKQEYDAFVAEWPDDTPIRTVAHARPDWTPLMLALLAVGLLYVRSDQAVSWSVGPEAKLDLVRGWFCASVNLLLEGARCLVQPKLIHLQTFCALTLLFQPFDYMALHDTMLAAMIQSGRMLGLHRLRYQPNDRSASSEIGRRIWPFLLAREIQYSGDSYCPSSKPTYPIKRLIAVSRLEPEPFATFRNVDEVEDAAILDLPLSRPTRVSYLLAGSRITSITRRLKMLPADVEYGQILVLDAQLVSLLHDLPFFNPGAPVDPSHPSWMPTAQHVMALKVSQRRLYLHRQHFALTLDHQEYRPSRVMSVEAALDIFHERSRHDLPFDDKLDTVNGIVPAAIVLLLDAIYPLPGQATSFAFVLERCQQVEQLLAPLRSSTYRPVAHALAKAFAAVDQLLAETLSAAQAAEMTRISWQAVPVPPDNEFGQVLDTLSFDSLLGLNDPDWARLLVTSPDGAACET